MKPNMPAAPRRRHRPPLAATWAAAWLGLTLLVAPAGWTLASDPAVAITRLDDPVIDESSGMARSQRRGDLLWTHNDSGGRAELYGITPAGHHAVTLALRGEHYGNIDWEDIASFRHQGQPFILIGDMGDNFAIRDGLTFYLVSEPALGPLPTGRPVTRPVDVLRYYEVSYPDGARDAEALAVDGRENMAYVVSKRDARPALYRFSLRADQARPIVMEALGPIDIPRAGPDYHGRRHEFDWVTAMDFDDSLSRAYVGTLLNGYFYDRHAGESWQQALSRPPRSVALPALPQIEGGSFRRHDRDSVYISSEQLPAGIARIRRH